MLTCHKNRKAAKQKKKYHLKITERYRIDKEKEYLIHFKNILNIFVFSIRMGYTYMYTLKKQRDTYMRMRTSSIVTIRTFFGFCKRLVMFDKNPSFLSTLP